MPITSRKYEDFLGLLPGYDPYLQAGDCWFDEESAALYVEFIETFCTHVKGPLGGQPIELEDWQIAFYANLFGWKRWSNSFGVKSIVRRYKEALLYVPRGNSKSTMASGSVLPVMTLEDDPGAEAYAAAADRGQARICFEITKGMTLNSAELSKLFKPLKYTLELGDKIYMVLSSDAKTKHGQSASILIIDELHAHKDEELAHTLKTSTLKRKNALVINMTTADVQKKSMCNDTYEYACKVRDGIINDPTFLPAIYEATEEDDWTSEETWIKANPNYHVMNHDYFVQECERAKHDLTYRNTFKRLHLNIRTKTTSQWFSDEIWKRCDKPLPDLRGEVCFLGVDLGTRDDLSAIAHAVHTSDGVAVHCRAWCCEDGPRDLSKAPFPELIERGLLTVTPGDTTDFKLLYEYVQRLMEDYVVVSAAYDPKCATEFGQNLQDEYGIEVYPFYQSKTKYNEPMDEFVRQLKAGEIIHGDCPLLRWAFFNIVVEADSQGMKMPNKAKSADKIDPAVATLMSYSEIMFRGEKTSYDSFEEDGEEDEEEYLF